MFIKEYLQSGESRSIYTGTFLLNFGRPNGEILIRKVNLNFLAEKQINNFSISPRKYKCSK